MINHCWCTVMIIAIANIRKNVQIAGTLRYIQRLPRLYCISSAWRSGNSTEATYIYAPVLVYTIISIFRKDSPVVMDVGPTTRALKYQCGVVLLFSTSFANKHRQPRWIKGTRTSVWSLEYRLLLSIVHYANKTYYLTTGLRL